MARPSKPIALCSGARTKEEIERRLENEKQLRGNNDKLKPSSYMTKEAKKIFKWLIKDTQEAETFGNVDKFILEQFSNTYATYKELEIMFNNETDFAMKERIDRMKKRYTDQLPRLYTELGLTPSTRAKLGALNLHKEQEEQDPLLQILKKREERMAKDNGKTN